jgi:hypothetical protein
VVRSIELLADFALDAWLVASYAPRLDGRELDGRSWERIVAGLLHRPGLSQRQGPGRLTLFGSSSASGVEHEIDGAANSGRGAIVIECKATASGITKGDVALFHFKVMDFYHRNIAAASRERWWRFLCGTAPTSRAARIAALSLGLLVCDPERLPLPVLVRAAARPVADMYLPDTLLQELIRLGERALRPQQELWPYRPVTGETTFRPGQWSDSDIADLLWLEEELSGYLLSLFERFRPGVLENRARSLICQARKVA